MAAAMEREEEILARQIAELQRQVREKQGQLRAKRKLRLVQTRKAEGTRAQMMVAREESKYYAYEGE